MLEYEWRELETLCERLADLRHRQAFALQSKNVGLMEGLRRDIERLTRQREQLVHHISARLGTVSATQAPQSADPAAPAAGEAAAAGKRGPEDTEEIVGVLS